MTRHHCVSIPIAIAAMIAGAAAQTTRSRARELGVSPGVHSPGPLNAITDVDGVSVGHTTVVEGDRVRTGVTAILPHPGNVFQEKVAGAVFVGNAFGKLAGSTQVNEFGTIETPIVLTNTLSVGTAMDAVVRTRSDNRATNTVRSVNALVGETNDGGLNDIRGLHVTREHVIDAIRSAKSGAGRRRDRSAPAPARCASGGRAASAPLAEAHADGSGRADYTVGVLAQTNFGGNLTIAGVPIYKALQPPDARPRSSRGRRAATELSNGERLADCLSKDEPRRTAHACSSSQPTRRSMHETSAVSPRARSSVSPGRALPTATAAAISPSPSPLRLRCAAVSTIRRRALARSCRPTRRRRCSRRRSRPQRKRSTTRCSRRPRCAPRTAPPKRFPSIASGSFWGK